VLESGHHVGLCPFAEREFSQQERQPEQQHAGHVHEEKRGSPVLARDVRKPPDVAEAHRCAESGDGKPEP
jgi:hypothetical protein